MGRTGRLSFLELLQHGKNTCDGWRTDIAEQGKYLILQHQGHRVLDCRVRLVTIVIGLEYYLAASDAAGAINVFEIGIGASVKLNAKTS